MPSPLSLPAFFFSCVRLPFSPGSFLSSFLLSLLYLSRLVHFFIFLPCSFHFASAFLSSWLIHPFSCLLLACLVFASRVYFLSLSAFPPLSYPFLLI